MVFDCGLNFRLIGHAIEATWVMDRSCMGKPLVWAWCSCHSCEEKGLMPKGISQQIEEMCRKFGLPVAYENWDKSLYQALTHDKKARGTS